MPLNLLDLLREFYAGPENMKKYKEETDNDEDRDHH